MERSAFVGGELAPKNHFLSDQILMEGCAKRHGGYTYLIVACREGVDQFEPPEEPIIYDVTFRPYFSNKTAWTGTVDVVGEGRSIPVSGGEFADTFSPEVVHIYKFTRPDPYP